MKAEMVENWNALQRYHHADFAAAEHAIELALDTARKTGERRWELLLRHWRLQLWLDDDLRRALPEAVDLLSLATDEQLRDVPQRICAFHDLVNCYVCMDAVGYCDDIIANSDDVLAQLPKRYNCADCARLHVANACGAAGRQEEAERHLRQFEANAYDASWAGVIVGQADTYASMGQWEEAERHYLRAIEQSRRRQGLSQFYLEGLLGGSASTGRARRFDAGGPAAVRGAARRQVYR